MNQGKKGRIGTWVEFESGWLTLAVFLSFLVLIASPVYARDAAFLDPGAGNAGAGDEAVRVEPKNDIDIGDSVLGVARRVDLFFVNQSGLPVKITKVDISGDGNVATEIATDDCSKQGTIPPGSRCNIQASITPSSPGPWTAEVLMTHDGAGRIARARLSGKTGGSTGEKKDMGLSLSTKEVNPVNFGDVDIGDGKIVRSALMVNDSTEPITLYSIDVIEASNGLQRLEQGCAVDMELKPGESCPVTLVWTPSTPGQVSTDLIIRHSGRLGFAVVPIRGTAKGVGETSNGSGSSGSSSGSKNGSSLPPPPSAHDLEKAAAGKIPPVSATALGVAASSATKVSSGSLTLIGTVGPRAVVLKPDGKTTVASAGDEFDMDDQTVKVVRVSSKSAELLIDGKKKTLQLKSSPELIAKASLLAKAKDASSKDKDSGGMFGGSSSASNSSPVPAVGASGAPSGGSASGGSMYGSATPSGAPK